MSETENLVRDKVMAIAGPELDLLEAELVELEMLRGGRRLTFRFLVDSVDNEGLAANISIGKCAEISRRISRAIEAVEGPDGEGPEVIPGRYTIEVSSPGVFRKLNKPKDFQRYVGSLVKLIVLREGNEEGTVQYRGEIIEADDSTLEIQDESKGAVEIKHALIKRANLDPDLDFGGKK